MLLPAKHIKLSESLIALGAFVLRLLNNPKNIDQLWLELKKDDEFYSVIVNHSYDNFLLSLDYLYTVGIININKKGEVFLCD